MMVFFEREGVSFASVTQQFNTATSMGRLLLHMMLGLAQFEREKSPIEPATRSRQLGERENGRVETAPGLRRGGQVTRRQ